MIRIPKNSTKKTGNSKTIPKSKVDNKENLISNEKIREFETVFKIMSYWEIDVSILIYEQRGKTRHNDNFLIISFQLKFNDNKIGAPVKLYEYISIDLEDTKNKEKCNKFIENVIKEKIDFMNLSSGIELKYVNTFKGILQYYTVSIENESIQIEKTENKNKDSLKTIEKTLKKIASDSAEVAIPLLITGALVFLEGKRK